MSNMQRIKAARTPKQTVEGLLWGLSGLCFVVLALSIAAQSKARRDALAWNHAGLRRISEQSGQQDKGVKSASTGAETTIGTLEIPALRLAVPIYAGVEDNSLLRGLGHVPGTAAPGGLGTIVLAGHRDTYLRPLKDIQAGMDIEVSDTHGIFHYTVDRSEVVLPSDVDSIAIKNKPELALVTCYPFYFAGPAPKRFIVHAHLASLLPDH